MYKKYGTTTVQPPPPPPPAPSRPKMSDIPQPPLESYLTSLDFFNDPLLSYAPHLIKSLDLGRKKVLKDAIWENRAVFKDKIVLEVGCGRSTGWLSLLASKAGATTVYSIEKSRIAYEINELVACNQASSSVQVIFGEIKDTDLPTKVDIIISEFWGPSLFYDSCLEDVLLARDKFLKPGGLMFPNKCSLVLCGIDDLDGRRCEIDQWENVWGYDMSPMKDLAIEEIIIYDNIEKDRIVTTERPVIVLDLKTDPISKVFPSITGEFQITAKNKSFVHGFGTYFKLEFSEAENTKKIVYSTSPNPDLGLLPVPTQTTNVSVFYVQDDILMEKDETIRGSFGVHKLSAASRHMEFKIKAKFIGKKCQVEIDNSYHFPG